VKTFKKYFLVSCLKDRIKGEYFLKEGFKERGL
jgi:hypothetical protein